uniref:Uncharacterized protein n=1 Tax=Glossina pallidipes TaxID=7398 RepID=A0A1A9ZUV2_GLOPL
MAGVRANLVLSHQINVTHVRDSTCYLLTFGSSRHDSEIITVNTTPNNVIELRTKTEQTPQQNECGKTLLKSDFADTQATLVEGDSTMLTQGNILRLPPNEWMIVYRSGEGDDDIDVIKADARGTIIQMVGGLNLQLMIGISYIFIN